MDKTRKCENHHPGRSRSHGGSTDRPTDQWNDGAQSRYRLLIQLLIVLSPGVMFKEFGVEIYMQADIM